MQFGARAVHIEANQRLVQFCNSYVSMEATSMQTTAAAAKAAAAAAVFCTAA